MHGTGRFPECDVGSIHAHSLRFNLSARLRESGADSGTEAALERREQRFGLLLESRLELRDDAGHERGLARSVLHHSLLQRRPRGVETRTDTLRGVHRSRALRVDGCRVRLQVTHVRSERGCEFTQLGPLRRQRGGRGGRGVVRGDGALLRGARVSGDEVSDVSLGAVDGRAGGLGPFGESLVASLDGVDDRVDARGDLRGAHGHGVGRGGRGE